MAGGVTQVSVAGALKHGGGQVFVMFLFFYVLYCNLWLSFNDVMLTVLVIFVCVFDSNIDYVNGSV